jgi:hypothetical protein
MFSTDVDFRTDGLGDKGPIWVFRGVQGGFNFVFGQYVNDPNDLLPGEESYFIFVRTNATAFTVKNRAAAEVARRPDADNWQSGCRANSRPVAA